MQIIVMGVYDLCEYFFDGFYERLIGYLKNNMFLVKAE